MKLSRRRALAIARAGADPREDAGEHDGEWCGDLTGRTLVEKVELEP